MLAEYTLFRSTGAFPSKSFGGGHKRDSSSLVVIMFYSGNDVKSIPLANLDLTFFGNLLAISKM
jgi:hypothetical protein